MTPRLSLSALLTLALLSGTAQAGPAETADFSELLSTTWVMADFAEGCAPPAGSAAAKAYESWRAENHISEIETYIDAQLKRDKALAERFRAARKQIRQKVAAMVPKNCPQLPQFLALERFRPAVAQAGLVEEILQDRKDAAAPTKTATKTQQSAAPLDPKVVKENAARIETVAFDTTWRTGWSETVPILLLKNGEAVRDMRALAYPGGLEAHKRDRPKSWTTWRRRGGEIQLVKSGAWKDLPYKTTYGPIAPGTRLDKVYHYASSSGSSDNRVTTGTYYSFSADGSFTTQRSVGSHTEIADTSAASHYESVEAGGEYRIDGYLLKLAYADGRTEYKAIVFDPEDPSPIWLNGYGFTE